MHFEASYDTDMIDPPFSCSPQWPLLLGRPSLSSPPYAASTTGELISSFDCSTVDYGFFGNTTSDILSPIIPTSHTSGLDRNMVGGPLLSTNHPMTPTCGPLGMNENIPAVTVPILKRVQPILKSETTFGIISLDQAQPTPTRGDILEMNELFSYQTHDVGYNIPSSFVNQPSLLTWELPLRFISPTGPVDSILIGLLQRQRNLALSGAAGIALTGPYHPNMRGLLNSEDSTSNHPVSSILADMIRRTRLKGFAEKAAALYIIYRLMQWQISPSAETYDNLPDWYGPRASQFLTGHPMWSTLVS